MVTSATRIIRGAGRLMLVLCVLAAGYALYSVIERAALAGPVSDQPIIEAAASATVAAAHATTVAGATVQATCGNNVMSPGDTCFECPATSVGSSPGFPTGSPIDNPCYPDQPIATYSYDTAIAQADSQQMAAEDQAQVAADETQVAYYKAVQAHQQAQARRSARRGWDATAAPKAGIAAGALSVFGVLTILYARYLETVPAEARWGSRQRHGRSSATAAGKQVHRHMQVILAGAILTCLLLGGVLVSLFFQGFTPSSPFAASATVTPSPTPTLVRTTPVPVATSLPVVTDPLTSNTGVWTVQAPGCVYAHAGYQVSNAVCLSNLVEGDGAVSVDVRLSQGPADPTDSIAYGVVVRHASIGGYYLKLTDGYEFALDAQGRWGRLNTLNGEVTSDFYSSSEIHTGPQATNTLMICFAAGHFEFYVNGVDVGSEGNPNTQTDGAIGFSAEDLTGKSTVTAVFNNFAYFAVCPVRPGA